MTPGLSEIRKAIFDGDELHCIKKDVLPSIDNGSFEIEGEGLYVIHPFFDREFVAQIKAVNTLALAIKVSFHNPDKVHFPDLVLRTYETKAIHRVCRTSRWSKAAISGCHCAVDGDYCGDGCSQPENNPNLKKGGSAS